MVETIPATANRPRTRQRAYKKPPALDVPDIDQDATERKRVLNVLAQRRYREKKRLSRLKSKSSGNDETQNSEFQTESSPKTDQESFGDDVIEVPRLHDNVPVIGQASNMAMNMPSTTEDAVGILAGIDFGLTSWSPLSEMALPSVLPDPNILPDFLCEDYASDEASTGASNGLQTDFSGSDLTNFLDTSSFGTSPAASTESFPDSYNLPLLQLTLLKGVLRIADRLNCKQNLWDLDANSAFATGIATPAALLPANWQPTPSQVSVPHHPLFDLLPWPSVRERAISILSLPDELRPPRAQGVLACVNFAYDLEDTAEGVRIHGEDPYDPGSWELGQVTFERWWFLFDNTIINTSNRWRKTRGAPPLLLKGGGASTTTSSSSSPAVTVQS